jgi:hypothetical protein
VPFTVAANVLAQIAISVRQLLQLSPATIVMSKSKEPLILSGAMIILGLAWLLNSFQVIPGVNWVWTLPLGALGLITLGFGGFNKVTVVIGPFLMIASVLSVMRQTDRLSADREVPLLMIVLGLLMLASYFLPLPIPDWAKHSSPAGRGQGDGT